jgi:phospholipid/cholesterol/gamma-HCH transport system substrate-binding protein
METRANFIAVGLFVVALFIGLLAFVVWLSNYQAERSYKQYWIYFDGSVKGLRVGSSVTFRGITVGEVTFIGFPADGNVEQILVKTRIDSTAPVRTDTEARLEIQGLAGGALIMLDGGSNTALALKATKGQKYPVIPSAPSQLDRLLEGAPALVEQIQALVARATQVLGDANQESLSGILANLNTLSSTLADRSESIESIVEDAKQTLAELKASAASVQNIGAALEQDIPPAVREARGALKNIRKASEGVDGAVRQIKKAAGSFGGASDQASALLKENRPAIHDFTSSTLYDLNAFLADTRVLVDNLNRLVTDVGRDPARFLFGGQQRGYETR